MTATLDFGDPLKLDEPAPFDEEPLAPLAEPSAKADEPPPYHSVVLNAVVRQPGRALACGSGGSGGRGSAASLFCRCSARQLPCLVQEPPTTSGRQAGSGTYGVSCV